MEITTEPRIAKNSAKRFEPRPLLHRSPYPSAFGSALALAARVQVARWDRALRRVEEEQERALRDILRHAARTDFGRAHGFASLRSYEAFAARVPVGDYDSFAPAIDRMRRGVRNVLVPERVRYFGNSSGSSTQGRPKFLPISERQIAHQRRAGADTLMRWLVWSGANDFLTGFTVGLFPPTTMREEGPTLVTSNP
ncbi:MAG TPA: GH3 auxin-responsive promoter family protein, partial [Labilithrix sp.]